MMDHYHRPRQSSSYRETLEVVQLSSELKYAERFDR